MFHDPTNAGRTAVNLDVDSLDEADRTWRGRRIVPGDVIEASFVRILPVSDPDGNTIMLLESR